MKVYQALWRIVLFYHSDIITISYDAKGTDSRTFYCGDKLQGRDNGKLVFIVAVFIAAYFIAATSDKTFAI